MQKIKNLLKATVVISVIMALVLPGAAIFTNNEISNKTQFNGATQAEVKNIENLKLNKNNIYRDNIVFPIEGDDILPSICYDQNGITVLTWTNQISFSDGSCSIWFSETPDDPETWEGWTITLQDPLSMFFDTAHVKGPLAEDKDQLVGVYMAMSEELAGYYEIPDVTSDASEWLFYTWNNGAPEPEYTCIADSTFYPGQYYPEMAGPQVFYIYREIYDVYDITGCPIFMHIDIRNDTGGVGFFDAQSFEKTAPASEADYVDVGTGYHTVVQFNDPEGPEKVVWKKVDPSIEQDYEFTPFQDTIATGTNPAIAANGNNVAIVYVDEGDVWCIYSSDDGENWQTSLVNPGKYPDIYAIGNTFYCTYINNNNLWLVTSDDGGNSWSSAEQVNAIEGSVYDDENSVDINAGGIVWVDESGADLDICYASFEVGSAPGAPTITGPNEGGAGTSIDFKFKAVDPDGDEVKYIIDWGDGNTDTTGFNPSGAEVTVSHTWADENNFQIKVKAQDENGLIGPEATKTISIPRTRTIWNYILFRVLERFPILEQLLSL